MEVWRGRDNHREPPFLSSNIHQIFHRHGRLGSDGTAPRLANERRQAEVDFKWEGGGAHVEREMGWVGEIDSWLVRRLSVSHGWNAGPEAGSRKSLGRLYTRLERWAGAPAAVAAPSGGIGVQKLTSLIKISPRLRLKNHHMSARANVSHLSWALMCFTGARPSWPVKVKD